jgi:ceramide glucosyltransferase
VTALVVAWAIVATGFTLVALSLVVRQQLRARAVQPPKEWPAIAILRPCQGLDPGLEENLLSSVTARYDGARSVQICVPSVRDPAFAVAERVRQIAAARAPHVPVQVRVCEVDGARNRKAAQLAQAPCSEAVIVTADSDVFLDEQSLPALVAALLADPRAGAAAAAPVDVGPRTLGDRASAALLSSTPHALLALAALSTRAGGPTLLAGALVAYRREALEAAGGFASLEPFLGEDIEISRRLHAAGRTLVTSAVAARFTDAGRTLPEVVRRYARWAMVVRQQRPLLHLTYFLLLGATPLVLLAAALVHTSAAWAAAGALAASRVALSMALRRCYGITSDPLRSAAASLVGEALIVAGAATSLNGAEVEWRGRRFRVGPNGVLDPV